ncbi:MAG: hypothetical protein ABR555_11235 [Pyrinomonadaceae bacterium]
MNDEIKAVKKSLRLIAAYALLMTALFMVLCFSAFTQSGQKQNFEELTAKRIKILDAHGVPRVLMGADYKKDCPGVFFSNEEGHENGAFCYHAKRDKDGKIDAYSLLTMDQFKSDQIVVLDYDHTGDRKRYGLTINDPPDVMSAQADEIIRELGQALKQADQSGKSSAEMDALRREYLSRIPAREIVARRLFAGRDVEGSPLVTLSDPDKTKVATSGRQS